MDSIVSDGLYFPFQVQFGATGGAGGGCPETPIAGPLKPEIEARDLKPVILTVTESG